MMYFKLRHLIIAFILDWIIGDPYSFPHPVKLMGRVIRLEEDIIRRKDRSPSSLRAFGFLVAVSNILLAFFIPYLILYLFRGQELIYGIINVYIIYACLAAKSLAFEATKVKDSIAKGIEAARYQLSFIVGRDTTKLEEDEIIKATIETVAENTSDGIIAPLFYTFILGAPGAIMYKMVNTMDSVLGYKNERYIDYGRYPALIDDVFNWIPARLTGFLMGLVGLFINRDFRGMRIMFRDRKNHASPNAGYPEAAVAGILGIQLGGDNVYHGKLVKKPSLGDDLRPVEAEDVKRTIDIMYWTEIFFLLIYFIFYIAIK